MKLDFRNWMLGIFSVLGIVLWMYTAPEKGVAEMDQGVARLLVMLSDLLVFAWGMAMLFIARRVMTPYVDFKAIGDKAKEDSYGAGMYALAVAVQTFAFAIVLAAVLLRA